MIKKLKEVIFTSYLLGALFLSGCSKEEEAKLNTAPSEISINNISIDTVGFAATLAASVSSDGGSPVISKGICYSKRNISPNLEDDVVLAQSAGIGQFTVKLSNLDGNTRYYVRAFATNALGTSYGPLKEFNSSLLPIVATAVASKISPDSAIAGGSIDSSGRFISDRGVLYGTNPDPSLSNGATVVKPKVKSAAFSVPLKNLAPGTTYFYRAFATTSIGTTYGQILSFVPLSPLKPFLFTNPVSNLNYSSITAGASIFNTGNDAITDTIIKRGFLISQQEFSASNPGDSVFNTNFTLPITYPIAFSSNISNLSPNTKYFIRAFAITKRSRDIGFGQTFSFTTYPTEVSYNGDVYKTVLIGSQLWLKENLKTTKFRDGSDISVANENSAWISANNQKQAASVLYNGSDAEYGRLYNQYAVVDARQLCPAGWHIPTDLDWTILYGNQNNSFYIKDALGWSINGYDAGFSAKPNGQRKDDGSFSDKGSKAFFWGSAISGTKGDAIEVVDNEAKIKRNFYPRSSGFSVRCLQD